MRSTRVTWAFGACFAVLNSCAIQREVRLQNKLDNHLRDGKYTAAFKTFESNPPREGAYRDLQRGELLMLQGAEGIVESKKEFSKVDKLVEDWVEKLRSEPGKVASKVAGYIFTEGLNSKYDLKDYELTALSYRLAIHALLLNNWSEAAVRARQISLREQALADNKKLTEATLKAEAEKKATNPPSFENIKGYPVNILKDQAVLSLKNSYQSAAAHYLAAFIFEANREVSMAAPNYRLAIELQPSIPFLREGLARLEGNVYEQPSRVSVADNAPGKGKSSALVQTRSPVGKSIAGAPQPIDRNPRKEPTGPGVDVLLVVETGLLSEITCDKLALPWPSAISGLPNVISFAMPVIHISPPENPGQFNIGNKVYNPVMVTDVDLMSRRWLREAMPGFIGRSISRMIAALAAQTALDVGSQVAMSQGGLFGSIFGAIAKVSSVAVGISAALTNISDVRYWSTLPSAIYMARFKLPRGSQTLVWRSPDGQNYVVSLNMKGRYGLVYARVLGGRLTVLDSGMFENKRIQAPVNVSSLDSGRLNLALNSQVESPGAGAQQLQSSSNKTLSH